MELQIESEVAPLESVILHSPGAEIEAMTPDTASELLYNDIIPLSVVQTHHHQLKEFLQLVCEVHELSDLATEGLAKDLGLRETLCRATVAVEPREFAPELEYLQSLSAGELVHTIVQGIPLERDSLTAFLSDKRYRRPPLPNLYFMRDSAAVLRGGVASGAMAYQVRAPEALLTRAAVQAAAGGCAPMIFDGTVQARPVLRLEGGDILVARKDLLFIGVSERTSSQAIDLLLGNLSRLYHEPFTVVAVPLPRERYAIHLDMLFSMVDEYQALVHAPCMIGDSALPVAEISVEPRSSSMNSSVGTDKAPRQRLQWRPSLLAAAAALGLVIEPILCGGQDTVRQAREQWLSACNAFAFGPGRIVTYDCNPATLEELSRVGFEVLPATEFISGKQKLAEHTRLAVTIPGAELARGGGGPRCMTLPLRRA